MAAGGPAGVPARARVARRVCALPAFAEALRARAPALRVAGAAGLALSAAVLVLAQSRLGLALGLVVAALLVYRATRRPVAVVIGTAVAIAAGTFAFGSGDGPESGFLHGREDTWSAAVETFLDRPLHGTGADAFLAGSARHQDGAAIVFAHDLPLEFAAELGVAGLLLALALYAATVRLVWVVRARAAPRGSSRPPRSRSSWRACSTGRGTWREWAPSGHWRAALWQGSGSSGTNLPGRPV